MLTPLTSDTIKLFVAIEEPSGDIDGRYARATATLLQAEYPRHLYQLASTIDRDGEDHFLKFRDIQLVLAPYGKTNPVYLRPVKEGDPGAPGVQEALKLYQDIVNDLFLGYFPGSIRNKKDLATARQLMFALDTEAEKLAASGIGIPYLSLFRKP